MTRKPWDEYWLDIADMVATRATCPRLHVGAVIVNAANQILSTGYNGSQPGTPHCEDVGCLVVDNHCTRTTHAEYNAILNMQDDATFWPTPLRIYCTHRPCSKCAEYLREYNNVEVKWRHDYPNDSK